MAHLVRQEGLQRMSDDQCQVTEQDGLLPFRDEPEENTAQLSLF